MVSKINSCHQRTYGISLKSWYLMSLYQYLTYVSDQWVREHSSQLESRNRSKHSWSSCFWGVVQHVKQFRIASDWSKAGFGLFGGIDSILELGPNPPLIELILIHKRHQDQKKNQHRRFGLAAFFRGYAPFPSFSCEKLLSKVISTGWTKEGRFASFAMGFA